MASDPTADAELDPNAAPGQDVELERAQELLAAARRVVVLTGAGISTDSGIPDFRGPNGVWTRDPEAERLSTIDVYMSDGSVRERAWLRRMDNPAWVADPNAGHLAIRDLDRQGRLHLLVTQNIDGLHLAAGHDPDRVVQVHGSLPEVHCTSCDWSGPTIDVLDRVRSGEADPPCPTCGGILKPRIVFFGESLVEDDIARAFDAAGDGDLLLAVGTTLSVYPVARMVPIAAAADIPVVIVNGEATEMDFMAAAVVHGSISDVLPVLLSAPA